MMPDSIQLRESASRGSRGGGIDGALYITDSDGNLNVFNVECNDNGLWLNSNNGNPDNFWNGNNRWLFRLPRNSLHFLSRLPVGGVLFLKLSAPSPKISADFFYSL